MTDPSPEPVVVIDVREVTKDFSIRVTKSLKERVLDLFRPRREEESTRFRALDQVSVRIRSGETVGLVGHNGSGKSTLLKVIGGIIEPSAGVVGYRGRIAALLELGAGFHPDLTGRENVYLNASVLGLSKQYTDSVFDDIVGFSGLGAQFIDTPVKFYSSGMYVRLAFAVAVHSDPEILLVDEVLAVGDERFQVKCLAKIRDFQNQGKTIILVSHSADQVADVCSRVVVLEHGSVIFDGDVAEGIRHLRDSYEQSRESEIEESIDDAGRVHRGPVKILGVEVLDAETMDPVSTVARGSDLVLRVNARVFDPVEWVTGFTLTSTTGQFVYLLNTIGIRLELPTAPGDVSVDFRLDNVNFGSTRLVVSAGATEPNGTPLDHLVYAAEFEVARDPQGAGVVQFDASAAVAASAP